MTADLDNLTLVAPFERNERITVGNGEGLPNVNTGQGNKESSLERNE